MRMMVSTPTLEWLEKMYSGGGPWADRAKELLNMHDYVEDIQRGSERVSESERFVAELIDETRDKVRLASVNNDNEGDDSWDH